MKSSLLLTLALVATGCSPKAKTFDEMTPEQQLEALRSQAAGAMQNICSNDITGLRRIINLYPITTGDAIVKWKGIIDAEYINPAGGVQRTNLHVIFRETNGRLYCIDDSEYYQQQFVEELNRIKTRRAN